MGDPYARQRPIWGELEQLVARAKAHGVSNLSFDEVEQLGTRYRLVTAHLAQLRQQRRDPQAIEYLNDLAIRAHGLIYRPTRERLNPLGFFVRTFPRTFRATWRYQACAWVLMLAAAAITFGAVQADRELCYSLIPSVFYPRDALHALLVDPGAQDALLTHGQDLGGHEKAFFSAWLMRNNARVGLLAFVSGVLGGVPTVLLLLYNGIMLGAFSAIFVMDGQLHPLFLPWILPHGITELLAVAICSAAGLYLGTGVLDPGRLPRRDAIRLKARVALRLAMGTLPMFVLAGLIESFLRQSHLPPRWRLVFAAITAVGWVVYLGWAGRKGES